MLQDIIKRREEILVGVQSNGVALENIQALLLTGSHYWGYDGEGSDVDLILVEKNWVERQPIDINEVNIKIFTHLKALERNMQESNWQKYYLLKYCSYPLYGSLPRLKFNPEKISEYLLSKRDFEVNSIHEKGIKEGFHSVMKRVFFINYYFYNIKTFKLTDYIYCDSLSEEEKLFMENMLIKLFDRVDGNDQDKMRLQDLCLRLEDVINEHKGSFEASLL
jgi:hypothetical protein